MKLLSIQDLSCYGKCSQTIALPVLSAMGVETTILPTALLSSHTGFPSPVIIDLTEEMEAFLAQWKTIGVSFDAIYIGYLTGAKQLSIVLKALKQFPSAKVIVDPAMGDEGKLYSGLTPDLIDTYRTLCRQADMILPNQTEAACLSGLDYEAAPQDMLKALPCQRAKVITGLIDKNVPRRLFSIYQGEEDEHPMTYRTELLSGHYHGTGDLFASVMTGCYMHDLALSDSVRIASEFTLDAVRKTLLAVPSNKDGKHPDGLLFEPLLAELSARLRNAQNTISAPF